MAYEVPDQGNLKTWAKEHLKTFISLGDLSFTSSGNPVSPIRTIGQYPPGSFVKFEPKRVAQEIIQAVKQNHGIDLLVIETQNMAQAALFFPKEIMQIPRIAVLYDVYSIYAYRQFRSTPFQPYKLVRFIEWLKVELYERKVLRKFSSLVAMSANDEEHLKWRSSGKVFISPNGVDIRFFSPLKQIEPKPPALIFVGNFGYEPNLDAFFYLINQIMPIVWAIIPETCVFAVGLHPSLRMLKEAEIDSRIVVTGRVDDVRPWYSKAACAVIPLRIGSGIKLKVLEAFSMEMPVVSTQVGMEGLNIKNGEQAFVEETPKGFAARVIEILQQPQVGLKMAQAARQFSKGFDWEDISEQFESYLRWVVGQANCSGAELESSC
jgi:glycosyltransferase involved in cell wall biosynthesis